MSLKNYHQKFINFDFSKISKQDSNDFEFLKTYENLVLQLKNDEIASISCVFDEKEQEKLQKEAKNLQKFKKIVLIGVGGSSLGAKAIISSQKNPQNEQKITFLESIDPQTLKNEFAKIDFDETLFLIVSKSGETIETVCQTLILLDEIGSQKIAKIRQNFVVITQNRKSALFDLAQKNNFKIIFHPSEVGGRFSCFCVVGLLPALLCGVDIQKFLQGAKSLLADFSSSFENEVTKSCKMQIATYEAGFQNHVLMPYIDRLKNFNDWYRQLSAESLGKSGYGATPINSMGTVDQHSQLQLYLEGKRDKFFSFFTLKNQENDFEIAPFSGVETIFDGKKLSEVLAIEARTTIEVLAKSDLPIRILELEKFDEEVLGSLMMQMFLEIIFLANFKKIDPFDQPGVEIRKKLARDLLIS